MAKAVDYEYVDRKTGEQKVGREWELESPEEVTPEIIEAAWNVVEGWYLDEPIDWEDVLNRAEKALEGKGPDSRDITFGADMLSPVVKKVQREVRRMKREATL